MCQASSYEATSAHRRAGYDTSRQSKGSSKHMGPYCKFCNYRCFVPRQVIVGGEIIWDGIMATCVKGAAFDRERLGADFSTAHNPLAGAG